MDSKGSPWTFACTEAEILSVTLRSFCLGSFEYLWTVFANSLCVDFFEFCQTLGERNHSCKYYVKEQLGFACTRMSLLKVNLRTGMPSMLELAETTWHMQTIFDEKLQIPECLSTIAHLKDVFSAFNRSSYELRVSVVPDAKPFIIMQTHSQLDHETSCQYDEASTETLGSKVCDDRFCKAKAWLKSGNCVVGVTCDAFSASQNIFSMNSLSEGVFGKDNESVGIVDCSSILDAENSLVNLLHKRHSNAFIFGYSSPLVTCRILMKLPIRDYIFFGKCVREVLDESMEQLCHFSGVIHTVAKSSNVVIWVSDVDHDSLRCTAVKEKLASFVSHMRSAAVLFSVSCSCNNCKTAIDISLNGRLWSKVKIFNTIEKFREGSIDSQEMTAVNISDDVAFDSRHEHSIEKSLIDSLVETDREKVAFVCALKLFTLLPPEFLLQTAPLSPVPGFFVEKLGSSAWNFLARKVELNRIQHILRKFCGAIGRGKSLCLAATRYVREFLGVPEIEFALRDSEEAGFLLVASEIRRAYDKTLLKHLYNRLWNSSNRRSSFTKTFVDTVSYWFLEKNFGAAQDLVQTFPADLLTFPIFSSGNGILHEVCRTLHIPLILSTVQRTPLRCVPNIHGETVFSAVLSESAVFQCEFGSQVNVAKELSKAGFELLLLDDDGVSAIVKCVQANDVDAFEFFSGKEGAATQFVSSFGETLLHYAAKSILGAETSSRKFASEKLFTRILKHFEPNLCINALNQYGESPLDGLYYCKCQTFMDMLLEKQTQDVFLWMKENNILLANLSESSTSTILQCLESFKGIESFHDVLKIIQDLSRKHPTTGEMNTTVSACHLLICYIFEHSVAPKTLVNLPMIPRTLQPALKSSHNAVQLSGSDAKRAIASSGSRAQNRGLIVFIMYQEYGHLSPTFSWSSRLSEHGFKVEYWNSEAGHRMMTKAGLEGMSSIKLHQEPVDKNGRRSWKVMFVNGHLRELLEKARPKCVIFDVQLEFVGLLLAAIGIPCISCATNESEYCYKRNTEESAEELLRDNWSHVWKKEFEFLQAARKTWHFWDSSDEEADHVCQVYNGEKFLSFCKRLVARSGEVSSWTKIHHEEYFSKWLPDLERILDFFFPDYKTCERGLYFVKCPVICRLEEFLSAYPKRLRQHLVLCGSEGLDSWPAGTDVSVSKTNKPPHIYLCFGSQTSHFCNALSHSKVLSDTFRRNSHWRVTVSVGGDEDMKSCFSGLSNVKCFDWLDQKQILSSGGVDLFITHGGHSSVVEGIFYRVPLLVVPYAWDQFRNAKTVELVSAGSALWKVDQDCAQSTIISVLNKAQTYRAASALLSEKMQQRASQKCASSFIEQYILYNELTNL